MSADREVIREFLAVLGFQVNEPSLKRFVGALGDTCRMAHKAGAGIIGVAAAAEAMTTTVARNMEKMFYSTQRTGASVRNMAAMEFGFGQIGLSAEEARDMVEQFAQTTRTMPGVGALLRDLGVNTNSDPTKQIKDLITQLKKLPYYVAVQYAEMFGISERTFKMLSASGALDKLDEAEKRQKQWYQNMGVDQEKAAESSAHYMNTLRDLWEQVGIVTQKIGVDLMPTFNQFHRAVSEWLGDLAAIDWTSIDLTFDNMVRFFSEQVERVEKMSVSWGNWGRAIRGVITGIRELDTVISASNNSLGWLFSRPFIRDNANFPTGPAGDYMAAIREREAKAEAERQKRNREGQVARPRPEAAPGSPTSRAPASGNSLFASLEQFYGLPSGLLDKVWATESNRGQNMLGPMTKRGQAKGHFQFLDSTAKEYGLEDPFDLNESATAAARKIANLMKYYKGDIEKAVAAYNWGEGNLDEQGLGRAPKETRDYMDKILGADRNRGAGSNDKVSLSNETNINVYGSDAQSTADAVAMAQGRVWGDVVRNFYPRMV